MRHLLILITLLLVSPGAGLTAQHHHADDRFALIVFKYNGTANLYGHLSRASEYEALYTGKVHRTFPTGPKLVAGDDRLPNGIHRGWIGEDGTITIYASSPLGYEAYRVTGPSLERRTIPLGTQIHQEVTRSAAAMRASGSRTIPVVILPGTLESAVADKLRRARDVREGQTLDDVEDECRRWKGVEEYIVRTGRLPGLRFEGDEIIVIPHAPAPHAPARSAPAQAMPAQPAIADDSR